MKRPYQCEKCSQSFHNKANLEIHLASGGENNEPKNCKECQMKFCTTYSLSKHIRFVHLSLKPKKYHKQKEYSKIMSGKHVSCKNCDQRFHSKVKMDYHMKSADTLTKCEHCDYKSCNKIGVSHHMKKIHGVNKTQRLKCPKCDQKFDHRSGLDSHLISERSFRVRICEDCGFKACDKLGFLKHMKKAHGKEPEQFNLKDSDPIEEVSKLEKPSMAKPYNCIKCNYKTNSKVNLDIHMKSKDESTICEHCDFNSCTKLGFSIHMKKVHGIKHHMQKFKTNSIQNVECKICDMKFSGKKNLWIHMKNRANDKPIKCKNCVFKACTNLGLACHINKNHNTVQERKYFEKTTLTSDANENNSLVEKVIENIGIKKEFSLTEDILSLKEKDMHKCSVCTYKAKNRTYLNIHIGKVHERKRNRECSICNARYSSRTSLKKHIDKVHEGKKGHQCSLCDASYTDKRNLADHVQVVHEGKKFECTLCDEGKYNQRRNLNLHIQRVHEGIENKYACTICSYKFDSNARLKKHIETVHEGKKPFRCDICDTKFAEKSTLNCHIKSIHENPKNCDDTKKVFHCESCPESFVMFKSLRQHILRLHEEVQVKCDDCGTSFAFNDDLKKHTANVHDQKNKTLKCSYCNDRFSNNLAIKKHISTAHEGSPIPEMLHHCQICDFKTKSIGYIKTHIQIIHEGKKPYHCIICDTRFTMRSNFRAHVAVVHEGKRSKKCDKCDKSFSTNQLLNSHNAAAHEGIKPFRCNLCEYATVKKYVLKEHIASVHEGKKSKKKDQKELAENQENRYLKHEVNDYLNQAKPFECTDCDMKFNSQSNFEFHMKNSGNPTKCNNCEFKSCTKLGLSRHKNDCNECRKSQINNDKLTEETPKTIVFAKRSLPKVFAFYCLKCDETFDDHQNLDFHMKISQATDNLEKCNKCDFKSCTINGLTKHENKVHTGYNKTSQNKFNLIKVETDSINDTVEKYQEIKRLEEFSMIGVNEDSELIVPEQLDDYDSC